jgi:hypothetical protein
MRQRDVEGGLDTTHRPDGHGNQGTHMFQMIRAAITSAAVLLLSLAAAVPAAGQELRWARQFGSTAQDIANTVAADSAGNVYVAGSTQGALGGPNAGTSDCLLAKYDASGSLVWMRQVGTAAGEVVTGVATNGAGHVYMTGVTGGDLGGPNAGAIDIFIAKYDGAGNQLWLRQTGSAASDYSTGIAVDFDGNAYVTGSTNGSFGGSIVAGSDIFLVKYDSAGNRLWVRQLGSTGSDEATGVAVDGEGNAYVTGFTEGDLGGPNAGRYDAFLVKYDPNGGLLWSRHYGNIDAEASQGVAVDGIGNVYITGYATSATVLIGWVSWDIVLAKYDPSGNQLWSRRLSSAAAALAYGVSVDLAGDVYVSGQTIGSLGGPFAGNWDVFLAKYDPSGNNMWIRQAGTTEAEYAKGVCVDGSGNVFIAGYTGGSLFGPNAGSDDVFLAKYGPPCSALTFTVQPFATTVCRTLATSFTVAASGSGPLSYRWRKGGVPIDLAVNPSAATDTLQISNVQATDGGSYDCVVTDSCVSVTSAAATLTTRYCACLVADLVGGGDDGLQRDGILDGSDFIAFINSFAIGDATVDPKADVAGGGLVGLDPDGTIDGTDFIIFINVFAAGC